MAPLSRSAPDLGPTCNDMVTARVEAPAPPRPPMACPRHPKQATPHGVTQSCPFVNADLPEQRGVAAVDGLLVPLPPSRVRVDAVKICLLPPGLAGAGGSDMDLGVLLTSPSPVASTASASSIITISVVSPSEPGTPRSSSPPVPVEEVEDVELAPAPPPPPPRPPPPPPVQQKRRQPAAPAPQYRNPGRAPSALRRRPRNIMWAFSDLPPERSRSPSPAQPPPHHSSEQPDAGSSSPRRQAAAGLLARILAPLGALRRHHRTEDSSPSPTESPQQSPQVVSPPASRKPSPKPSEPVVPAVQVSPTPPSTAHKKVYVNLYRSRSASLLSLSPASPASHKSGDASLGASRHSLHPPSCHGQPVDSVAAPASRAASRRPSAHSPRLSPRLSRRLSPRSPPRPSPRPSSGPSPRPSPLPSPRPSAWAVATAVAEPRPRFFVPMSEEGVLSPWPRLTQTSPPVSNPMRRAFSIANLVAPDSLRKHRELLAAMKPPPPRPRRKERSRPVFHDGRNDVPVVTRVSPYRMAPSPTRGRVLTAVPSRPSPVDGPRWKGPLWRGAADQGASAGRQGAFPRRSAQPKPSLPTSMAASRSRARVYAMAKAARAAQLGEGLVVRRLFESPLLQVMPGEAQREASWRRLAGSSRLMTRPLRPVLSPTTTPSSPARRPSSRWPSHGELPLAVHWAAAVRGASNSPVMSVTPLRASVVQPHPLRRAPSPATPQWGSRVSWGPARTTPPQPQRPTHCRSAASPTHTPASSGRASPVPFAVTAAARGPRAAPPQRYSAPQRTLSAAASASRTYPAPGSPRGAPAASSPVAQEARSLRFAVAGRSSATHRASATVQRGPRQGLKLATPSGRHVVHSTPALAASAVRRPSPQRVAPARPPPQAAPVAAPRQRVPQPPRADPAPAPSRTQSRLPVRVPSSRVPLSAASSTKARPSASAGPAAPLRPARPVPAPRTSTAARAATSAPKPNDDVTASPSLASRRRQSAPHRQASPLVEAPRPMPRKAYGQPPYVQAPVASARVPAPPVETPPQWLARSPAAASPYVRFGRPGARRGLPQPSRVVDQAPRMYKAPVPPPPYAPPQPPRRAKQPAPSSAPPKNAPVVVKKEPPERTLLTPSLCALRLGRGGPGGSASGPVPCCTTRCPVASHSPPRTQVEAPCGGLHSLASTSATRTTPQRAAARHAAVPKLSGRKAALTHSHARRSAESPRNAAQGAARGAARSAERHAAPGGASPQPPRRMLSATRRLRRGSRARQRRAPPQR